MINGEYWGQCDLCGRTICCDSCQVAIVHGKAICEDCIDEIKNNAVKATKENRRTASDKTN